MQMKTNIDVHKSLQFLSMLSSVQKSLNFHLHVFRLFRLDLVVRDSQDRLSDLVDPRGQVVQEFPLRPYFHEVQVHLAHRQDPQDLFGYQTFQK